MVFSTTSILGALLAIAPLTAHAHMIISNPVPYGPGIPSKSPLDASGSNFPCQAVPYTVNKMNEWPVGSNQSVVFVGTAVHNGGSCQISVTLDKAPTKQSKWKVIHSFEGGCPLPPKEGGNYKEGGPGPPPLSFKIPEELPDGEASMSLSWQNKVGNREFYQNCAPVKVSGGAKDNTAFDALPDMAVANIASVNSCHTTEGMDYTYENPGKYVTKGGKGPFQPLCGGGATTPGTPPPPGDAPAPAPAPAAPGAPANPGIPSPAAPASSTPSAASGNLGASSQAPAIPVAPSPSQAAFPPAAGNGSAQTSTLRTIITVTAPMGPPPAGATPAPSVAVPSSQAASDPAQAPAASPQAPASPSQAPAAGGSTSADGQTCSPDGSIVCSADGTQFGLCNFGKAVMQPVAGGTKCQGGKIGRRQNDASTLRTVYA
jgi:hypothetical protein